MISYSRRWVFINTFSAWRCFQCMFECAFVVTGGSIEAYFRKDVHFAALAGNSEAYVLKDATSCGARWKYFP